MTTFIKTKAWDGERHLTWQEVATIYNAAQKIQAKQEWMEYEKKQRILNVVNFVLGLAGGIPGQLPKALELASAVSNGVGVALPFMEGPREPLVELLPMTLAGVSQAQRNLYVAIAERIIGGSERMDIRTANLAEVTVQGRMIGVTDGSQVILLPGIDLSKVGVQSLTPSEDDLALLQKLTAEWKLPGKIDAESSADSEPEVSGFFTEETGAEQSLQPEPFPDSEPEVSGFFTEETGAEQSLQPEPFPDSEPEVSGFFTEETGAEQSLQPEPFPDSEPEVSGFFTEETGAEQSLQPEPFPDSEPEVSGFFTEETGAEQSTMPGADSSDDFIPDGVDPRDR